MRLSGFILVLLCVLCLGNASFADPEVPSKTKEPDFLSPSGGQLGIGGDEGWGLGTAVGDPTALYGPTRVPVVLFGTDRESLIDLQGYYIHQFSDRQRILVEGHIDPAFTGLDVSYSVSPVDWEGALTFNTWVSSGRFAPYGIDNFEVMVPVDEDPFVQQMGAGVEYIQPFTEDLDVAFGVNYAQYGFSNQLLGGTRYQRDINGFPLTVSATEATERFVALRVNGLFSSLNDRDLPTEGTKLRFGMEQGIELGNSSTSFNRLATNIAHLFSVPGFNEGDHSLLLNLQAGTILGDPPPTRAFHLGGAASVRGYDPGELASGKSFVQASAEYRHHLTDFNVFDHDVEARMAVFYDYASTLGTEDQLRGIPPQLYGKRGEGYGYGAGVHLATKYGLFRFESAWNGQGRNSFYMTVGERF
jgi:outer membrane protein insertion porin family